MTEERNFTIKPMRDLVFLKPAQKPEKKGEIIIPDQFKYHKTATVIAVGPKVVDLKPGDTIFLGEATGGSVEFIRGEKFIVMKESNIPGGWEENE